MCVKALVFHRPGHVEVNDVEDPRIEDPQDVILRVTSTAICGSDLHIYNGFMPQLKDMVLGHEFMGVIEETGPGVKESKKGDRVVVPFPIACGHCFFCNDGLAGPLRKLESEEVRARRWLARSKRRRSFWLHRSLRRLPRRAGRVCACAVRELRTAQIEPKDSRTKKCFF